MDHVRSSGARRVVEDVAIGVAAALITALGLKFGLAGLAVALVVLVGLIFLLVYRERRLVPPASVRVAEYQRHLRQRRLALSTQDGYTRALDVWFEWLHGRRTATAGDVERYLDAHPTWKPKTINFYLTTLSGYYDWAIRQGYATTNPIDRIDRPDSPWPGSNPISEVDLQRAIDSADDQVRAMLQLGARAGLSPKEIAQLHTRELTVGEHPRCALLTGKGIGADSPA